MEKLKDCLCSELPDTLKEEVLKRLPVECLCRFRSVCQQWNDLFTSTQFIIKQWAAFPSNKKPQLVLCDLNSQNRCWAYCFSTNMWKPYFSLSFIDKMYRDAYYHGSAAGLLFVDMLYCPEDSVRSVFRFWKDPYVLNPLTGRSLMLPAASSKTFVVAKGIVAGECDGNRQTYKVVVVRDVEVVNHMDGEVAGERSGHLQIVEIYDSAEKCWSAAKCLPQNVLLTGDTLVFSKGYFYCMATSYSGRQDNVGRRGVVCLNLQNESSLFAPFPGLANRNMCHRLVVCQSRVLLAGCLLDNKRKMLKEVHISGLLKVKVDSQIYGSWMEITRMPPRMCEDVRRVWPMERSFEFVGVGDRVCFRGRRSMKVAVYSLSEKSWSWLPICPLQNHSRVSSNGTWISSFEPRPDMKVS